MITLKLCKRILSTIKGGLRESLDEKSYGKALRDIDCYARVAQLVNFEYRDDEIEIILKDISEKNLKPIEKIEGAENKKIVFYDQIGTTACLALQYLRTLKSLSYEIFYIYESNKENIKPALLSELNNLCVKAKIYNEAHSIEKAVLIQKEIAEYKAKKIIIHSPCYGSLGSVILHSLPCMERYRIVPGDHHFYIGVDCIDHFIEFREYGVNLDVLKRKITIEKIHQLMYYPITDSFEQFQGFPVETKGKLIIGAAGNEYKFHGSTLFFDVAKELIQRYKDICFVLIGGKSEVLQRLIEERGMSEKFFCLGYRQDFVECVKHVDIYFNSYPIGGALTSMTAAFYNKPILSLHDEEDKMHCLNSWFKENVDKPLSYTSPSELIEYADMLITDVDFRKKEGVATNKRLLTKEDFKNNLKDLLEQNGCRPHAVIHYEWMEYLSDFHKRYVTLQNTFKATIFNLLLYYYGGVIFIKFPYLLRNNTFVFHMFSLIKDKL
jgi:glycosyltransferase involved in cell wall biosynthesis